MGFEISCMYTKYITCNFDIEKREMSSSTTIVHVEVSKCEAFSYLI